MRRLILASLAVVLVAVTGLALAAPPIKGNGQFTLLGIQPISGDVTVQEQAGKTRVQLHVRGLDDQQLYRVVRYTDNGCSAGEIVLVTTLSPKNGKIMWNAQFDTPAQEFESVALVQESDLAKSCADVIF